MKIHYLATFFLASVCSLSVSAQTDNEDKYIDMRPECSVQVDVDGVEGVHRHVRRIGIAGQGLPVTGTPRIPIVLVEFADRPFYAAGTTPEKVRENYDLFFNGFDDNEVMRATGSQGSVFSYFDEMSHGQFLPEFDIIGPVQLEHGYAFYGANSPGRGKDINISSFYEESVSKAVKQFNVDWKSFDNNGDGKVDIVYFVHAGWGENILSYTDADGNQNNMDPDAIWAKEGTSSVSVTTEEGQRITFACYGVSAEARFIDGNKMSNDAKGDFAPTGYNPDNMKMDGIGVCLHEISHALGLPDFYDLNGKAYGMDVWSIMDYGEYANSGYNPGIYNAYERNFMGWEELPVLTEPQVVTLRCFADGGHGYKVLSPYSNNEYYVIENRQPKGWDVMACKYAHGMMVTHVDYLQSKWTGNRVNTLSGEEGTADHFHMMPIAANNQYKSRGIDGVAAWREGQSGMPFPGTNEVYNLLDDTNPAAALYNGGHKYSAFMGKPIRNITENEDGTITFCFCTNGKLDVPEVNAASEIGEDGFTASWSYVENATKYVVEMEVEGCVAKVDTISDLSITYTNLPPSTAIKYRVMAIADMPEDYVSSEWSEYQYLSTDEDYIEEIPNSEKMVAVYSTNGMLVSQCKASELQRVNSLRGIYVVKYSNGATRKVMIR